ncbi:heterokaryon incompatibility protein-domain-containing protein [Bisporella sp. PMI_857]|nr:heterokaryon incompatibility protein-domain-containing protein [Bisporella sp. PMI_857]
MGLHSSTSVPGSNYGSINTFLFLIGEAWKPRPLQLQIYDLVSYSTPSLQYDKDSKGVARAHGSRTSLSLARPISELATEEDIDNAMALARAWLVDCDQNHARCHEVSDFIPTRLIDVGPPDGSKEPCLYITSENDRSTPYLNLSYCWGEQSEENMNVRTTEETYRSRLEQIKMEELPLCFRDAVLITRNLGYRFLWIDALCIIQDQESKADWMVESAKMAQIYAKSTLTISAGSSNRCNSRILQRRESADVGLQLKIENCGREETIGVREFPKCLQLALSLTKISKRGWAMQERMLSKRILHFTGSQVFWQCTTDVHSEDGRNKAEMPMGRRDHRSYLHEDVNPREALQEWFDIVDRHKDLELSKPEDRLPSLAGIARAYQRLFKSKYLFGLWESHLPENLLWNAESSREETAIDYGIGQSPSWSWANAPGKIHHGFRTGFRDSSRVLTKVNYAIVDGDDEDNMFFGQGKNGRIGLCGKLKRLKYEYVPYSISWLGDPDQVPYNAARPALQWQDRVNIDRKVAVSRVCWGLAISQANIDDIARCSTEVLVLEEVNKNREVFKRCGTATLSFERYSRLFEGIGEKDIEIV